jgi:Type II/IV secretion system protein
MRVGQEGHLKYQLMCARQLTVTTADDSLLPSRKPRTLLGQFLAIPGFPGDGMSHLTVRTPFYSGVKDYTFFLPADKAAVRFKGDSPIKVKPKIPIKNGSPTKPEAEPAFHQVDETATLELCAEKTCNDPNSGSAASRKKTVSTRGRLNVCSCFAGEQISCTFRIEEGATTDGGNANYHQAYKITNSGFRPKPERPWRGYGKADPLKKPEKSSMRYMNSMDEICRLIYDRILAQAPDPRGLIVVAGATNAGKSKVARGLIYKHLEKLVPKPGSKTRRPHLVTFEDPIEVYWKRTPGAAVATGIDYTPREWKKDVGSLREAVDAALRQTPALFFAGETRDPEDWKQLFRIAATGHLCLTTTHAGSLTETMGHLLHAMEATTPARRSELARRVLAVVHLRQISLPQMKGEGSVVSMTLPAMWIASPVSEMTLMADGLTSLLPFRDSSPGQDMGCFGRTYFAEQLIVKLPEQVKNAINARVHSISKRWDLEGI